MDQIGSLELDNEESCSTPILEINKEHSFKDTCNMDQIGSLELDNEESCSTPILEINKEHSFKDTCNMDQIGSLELDNEESCSTPILEINKEHSFKDTCNMDQIGSLELDNEESCSTSILEINKEHSFKDTCNMDQIGSLELDNEESCSTPILEINKEHSFKDTCNMDQIGSLELDNEESCSTPILEINKEHSFKDTCNMDQIGSLELDNEESCSTPILEINKEHSFKDTCNMDQIGSLELDNEDSCSTTISEIIPLQQQCAAVPVIQETEYNRKVSDKQTHSKKKVWKKKPDRFCKFCHQIVKGGKLKRHIERKHKTDIGQILANSPSVKKEYFDQIRRDGIHEYNVKQMEKSLEPSMRERIPVKKDSLRLCEDCKGYYSNKYFFKHKCLALKPTPMKPSLMLSTNDAEIKKDTEFQAILNRFHDDFVGNLCRTNDIIIMIGYRHFNLRRHENGKEDEVRKVVMSEMRSLARLYSEFEMHCTGKTVEDMLSRTHLEDLCEAVNTLTKRENNSEKHGLKLHLDAVILRSVKALKGYYASKEQDDKKKELKHFKDAYEYKSKILYPKARQMCINNSFEKARKPANLPDEMELRKLKNFIEKEIVEITQNFHIKDYAYLRTLVVSRLTLFNARRGEEASRMLLSEWDDAMKSTWLPEEQVEQIDDEAVKYLVGQFKLCYLQGKGKKFAPVLVPNDIVKAIDILVKERYSFGISNSNKHVFATKERSGTTSHCSGWHALREVCKKADVAVFVTATKMRHRLSTVYASLDMSVADQKIFLEHMGHEKDINKDNYQCPQGIRTVKVMGKMLKSIDKGDICTHYNKKLVEPVELSRSQKYTVSKDPRNTEKADLSCEDEQTEDGRENSMKDDGHFQVKDAEPVIDAEPKKSGHQVKWTKKDTALLKDFFGSCIFSRDVNNKGQLPSKEQIKDFINKYRPESLSDLPFQEQYLKTRAKLFNERKTVRLTIQKKIKNITCSK
ncbi:uncharacterized protein LOC132738621 isoform X2 [Ruditapes philippinarum]|nr:uncharacterized protein LOC132738621 isoform X2 [Ruditapes philippinarum]XP_060582163.1 uncharacterized protein LOC132738621 isoform X2 [Ruditapes philippinarum]